MGVNANINNGADYNEKGVTPNIGMPAGDEAESTTKSTIAEGEIEIRDKENQKQDLAGLNRDTQNSLNKLGEIFDKDSIKERQELAGLFGEIAYKSIGDLAIKNGWEEGSAEKNALHALVGGIMSELGGSDFIAGASGAMVNEMIQKKLGDMFEDDPAMHQWASALIGSVVSQIVSGNAQAGASTAASATKNNRLSHEQYLEYLQELKEAVDKKDIGAIHDIIKKYGDKDLEQEKALVDKIKNDPEFVQGLISALEKNPDLEVYEGIVINGNSIFGDGKNSNELKEYVGTLENGKKVLIHSEHPLYNSQSGATNFINDFFNANKHNMENFNKEIIKSYGIESANFVMEKLPQNIIVGKTSYDVLVNGKTMLSGVSIGGTVTTMEGTYDIYVDTKKYRGTELAKAVVIDTAAVIISLRTGKMLNNNFSEQLGYLVPLADGTIAYLVNRATTTIKENTLVTD